MIRPEKKSIFAPMRTPTRSEVNAEMKFREAERKRLEAITPVMPAAANETPIPASRTQLKKQKAPEKQEVDPEKPRPIVSAILLKGHLEKLYEFERKREAAEAEDRYGEDLRMLRALIEQLHQQPNDQSLAKTVEEMEVRYSNRR